MVDFLWEYQIDIFNFYMMHDNEILLFKLVSFLFNCDNPEVIVEELDWYFYEDVSKVIWVNDKKYNVESIEDFVDYLIIQYHKS